MEYRTLLSAPHVVRLMTGTLIGRLPSVMAAVAIPLTLRDAGADYAFVGAVAGTFALAMALGGPLAGRSVDRWGQLPVLVPAVVVSGLGFFVVALLPEHPGWVLLGAALAGAATPPLEPALRVLWPSLVGPQRLQAAYAMDSAAQEVVFVGGPLVVALCGAVASPPVALVVGALLGAAGVAIVVSAELARRWRAARAGGGQWLGPLASPGLVVLILGLGGVGAAIGALSVFTVSYAERVVLPGGAPTLLALNAVGAMAGALVYGRRSWPGSEPVRAAVLALGLALGYAVLLVPSGPVVTAVAVTVAGVFLAPLLTVSFGLVGRLAPPGTTTEAFAWLVTTFTLGNSVGAAVSGVLQDAAENGAAAGAPLVAVVGAGVGTIVLLAGRRPLAREPQEEVTS